MSSLRTLPLALACAIAGCAGTEQVSKSPPRSVPSTPPATAFSTCIPLTITAQTIDFTVDEDVAETETRITNVVAEYPTTPKERQTGLQNRTNLDPQTAMLFSFDGEHNPVLWMKDTPASLDMVFFNKAGKAFHVEYGTEPFSTAFITPDEPRPIATHVLELPAGRAEELGIYPGETHLAVGDPAPCDTWQASV